MGPNLGGHRAKGTVPDPYSMAEAYRKVIAGLHQTERIAKLDVKAF